MEIKRTRFLWVGILLAVVVFAASMLCGRQIKQELDNTYAFQFALEGDTEITVEYGETYVDPGVKAYFSGTYRNTQPKEVKVSLEKPVDTMTLGTQLIKYVATYKDHVGTAYRVIRVVDTTPPEISLTDNKGNYILPNETYQEEGYSAVDRCDGDLTDKVLRKETREKVIYTVSDLSGNQATAERFIYYKDPHPPVLKLNGSTYVTVRAGQQYYDPGYVAADNIDGNITGKVQVSGTVDTEKNGVYTLTYTVTDSGGNKATASRKVTVLGGQNTMPADTGVLPGKVIYLTFDDGPGVHTERLLRILKQYDVKATFFVTDKPKYNELIQKAHADGHTIAIHTMTHKYSSIYASEEAYLNDLYGMQQIIREQTGQETTLVRFPGGSSNTVSRKYCSGIMTRLTKLVGELGFRYFDWNVDSKDAGGAKTAEQVFRNVINGIGNKKCAVVLQHDIKGYSVDAVERIIVWGLENGYAFLPLDSGSPDCHHNVRN